MQNIVIDFPLVYGCMILMISSMCIDLSRFYSLILCRRPDPNGILSFLVSQLQLAEDLGQRSWIIAHMPPGGGDVLLDQVLLYLSLILDRLLIIAQSNYYDQVIQRYRNTIAGQFFGHTHAVSIRLNKHVTWCNNISLG